MQSRTTEKNIIKLKELAAKHRCIITVPEGQITVYTFVLCKCSFGHEFEIKLSNNKCRRHFCTLCNRGFMNKNTVYIIDILLGDGRNKPYEYYMLRKYIYDWEHMCHQFYSGLLEKYGNYYKMGLNELLAAKPSTYELNQNYFLSYEADMSKLLTEKGWIIDNIKVDNEVSSRSHATVKCPNCSSGQIFSHPKVINCMNVEECTVCRRIS
jgi:hypothetical protein